MFKLGSHVQNPRSAIQAHIDRSREIFKLQYFPDVTITQMCSSTILYRSFSVYFIKTKAHICINELACHRGYFVGLLFREISLKHEEQK